MEKVDPETKWQIIHRSTFALVCMVFIFLALLVLVIVGKVSMIKFIVATFAAIIFFTGLIYWWLGKC